MASIRGFLLASLTIVGSFGAAIAEVLTSVADDDYRVRRALFEPVFPTFASIVAWVMHSTNWLWKPDAHAALALDRLGRQSPVEPSVLQRFKSFIERARSHRLWNGDEFLHGRPNHLMC